MSGQGHAPAALPTGNRPNIEGAGWAPGPVWTVAENLAPIGIRFPRLPVRSESLYQVSYSGPLLDTELFI